MRLAGSPPSTSPPRGDDFRGGFSHASPPNSPQAAYRSPVRRKNGYQSFGDYLGSSPGSTRPNVMPVQYPQVPLLPHHPQPHFYGVSEADVAMIRHKSTSRTSSGSFYGFDTLEVAGDPATDILPENVLLVAGNRDLVVYRIQKNRLDVFGHLEGLRGNVIGAKILPLCSRDDPLRSQRPLISVVIHGPVLPNQENWQSRPDTGNLGEQEFEPSESMLDALHCTDTAGSRLPAQYQTTVEVYSLKNISHVTTLLKCPPVALDAQLPGHPLESPFATGNLSLRACGKFLIIASGTSGEIYVFEASPRASGSSLESFRCLGKTWTSMLNRPNNSWSTSSASSETESTHDGSPTRAADLDVPTLSLSHRWLAIVPPVPSSRSTLHCQVNPSSISIRPPGLTSHTAPSQPQVNCELDIPLGESVINRMARDAAQEVIKGAKWLGEQGAHYWKNYWSKPEAPPPPQFGSYPPMQQQIQQVFPPTHANDEQIRASNQPVPVSILDLERLSSQDVKPSVAIQPVATFALSAGCSFLSFNPSGLSLLTASAKGDTQHVWDLMRMIYGKSKFFSRGESAATDNGPTVRQIARFTRVTTANIVDVVWTAPRGEKLAMVTDRGTVHIFDLPPSAFQWPPPRRVTRPATTTSEQAVGGMTQRAAELHTSKGITFGSAMNMVSSKAPIFFSAVRGRPQSIGSTISGLKGLNMAAGAGAKGGKAVAIGIGKSVGAATGTVNSFRHLGENRLQIPSNPSAPNTLSRGCIRWLSGELSSRGSSGDEVESNSKERSHLAVVGAGILRIHHVRQSNNVKAAKRRPSVIGEKLTELLVPPGSTSMISPDLSPVLGGYWPSSSNLHPHKKDKDHRNPTSHAELSTNAPYQPFHTDHRINLHIYTSPPNRKIHHLTDHTTPWVFGEEIPTTKICSGAAISEDVTEAGNVGVENLITFEGEGQVVVSTRRRREEDRDADDDFAIVEFAEERV